MLIMFRDLRCLFSLFLVYFTYMLSKLIRQNKSMQCLQATSTKAHVPKENTSSFHAADDSGAPHVTDTVLNTTFQPRAHTPLPCPHSCSKSPACHASPPWRHVAVLIPGFRALAPCRLHSVYKSRSSEICTAKQRECASSHRRLMTLSHWINPGVPL